MNISSIYGEFCQEIAEMDLPDDVMHHAKRSVIDWFAVTLLGGRQNPAKLIGNALKEELGVGSCTLLPSGIKTTPRNAALINGTASHTIEFDDIFRDGLYHPGSPIIAAALATAEIGKTVGEEFLRGIIGGYEISNRIAMAVVPEHYKFWHTTATVGFFGAATAASSILKLNSNQTAHALATVGSMAAGLQQAFRSDGMTKPIHAGRAAEGGLFAASIAREGAIGALDILEGELGFGNAMAKNVDWQTAIEGLGHDFTIMRMTQKNHAACGHVHAIIDAINELKHSEKFVVDEINYVLVGSYDKAREICGNSNPKTVYEAKFSAQYCTAIALVKGTALRTDDFTEKHLCDQKLKALMGKVRLETDDNCQSAFPKSRSARVEIGLKDGTILKHFAPTRKGDPDNPLTDGELSDKYSALVTPIMGDLQAAQLLENLWSLENIGSMQKFLETSFSKTN